MRSGACYEHPTWEPPTVEPDCSWLLPTPAAYEPGGTLARYHDRLWSSRGRNPAFVPLAMLAELLDPTPSGTATASPSSDGNASSDGQLRLL